MLILASGSPRRRELLSQAGLDFTVESADINEDPQTNEPPAKYVQRLAVEKAQAVWERHKSDEDAADPITVLGADTTVVVDGEILGKPASEAEARRMLERLSGRTHQVMTGIAAVTRNTIVSDVEITQVFFDLIDEHELLHYLASGEPLDKAGAYGIQGYAARWIPRVEGCYFNVMGLPIARTIGLLAKAEEGPSEATPPV
jgi:septum formation protein